MPSSPPVAGVPNAAGAVPIYAMAGVTAADAAVPPPPPAKSGGRKWLLVGGGVFVVLVLVAGGAFAFSKVKKARTAEYRPIESYGSTEVAAPLFAPLRSADPTEAWREDLSAPATHIDIVGDKIIMLEVDDKGSQLASRPVGDGKLTEQPLDLPYTSMKRVGDYVALTFTGGGSGSGSGNTSSTSKPKTNLPKGPSVAVYSVDNLTAPAWTTKEGEFDDGASLRVSAVGSDRLLIATKDEVRVLAIATGSPIFPKKSVTALAYVGSTYFYDVDDDKIQPINLSDGQKAGWSARGTDPNLAEVGDKLLVESEDNKGVVQFYNLSDGAKPFKFDAKTDDERVDSMGALGDSVAVIEADDKMTAVALDDGHTVWGPIRSLQAFSVTGPSPAIVGEDNTSSSSSSSSEDIDTIKVLNVDTGDELGKTKIKGSWAGLADGVLYGYDVEDGKAKVSGYDWLTGDTIFTVTGLKTETDSGSSGNIRVQPVDAGLIVAHGKNLTKLV